MAKPAPSFQKEMEAAYDLVDANFQAEGVYGERGAQIVQRLAARASHHPMPYGLAMQAALASSANGACVQAFPGSKSPVSLVVLNVNLPQTRKSQLNMALQEVTGVNDDVATRRAKRLLREAHDNEHGAEHVTAKSTTLCSFTESAFFHRCSADWDQVQLPGQEGACGRGRFHYSTLLNLDEAYKFLRMLGLVQTSGPNKGNEHGSVTEAASEFNRLMQTGRTALATKTSGSYGEGSGVTNLCGVGNVHPSVYIPVLRGEAGSHHVAAKERLVESTGRPVEPHAAVPLSVEVPEDFQRWVWSPLLDIMLQPLGLPEGANKQESAAMLFTRAVDEDLPGNAADAGVVFHPDHSGYEITLADGTPSRLRFRHVEAP